MADVPASAGVQRLVDVMDVLRSPGGCEWDAEQTHESLIRYALEEVYELADAIEGGDRAHLREELGDVLLQAVFHARMAQDHPDDPFTLDDVAELCADKLISRHPHVFGDAEAPAAADRHARWDAVKAEEKSRESVMDGIPAAQPALARAQKVISRAQRAGIAFQDEAGVGVGKQLLALVAQAQAEGVDAEGELRGAVRSLEDAIRAAEAAQGR